MSERDDYADLELPPPGRLVRGGRRIWPWLAVVFGLAGLIGLSMLASVKSYGVGHYDQVVVIETSRPIRGVMYAADNVDDERRRLAEDSADPCYFDYSPAALRERKWFVARLMFTDTEGPLRPTRVGHQPHLAVMVEFEDGSRACRVVDLPPGTRPPPITIRIP